MPNFKITILSDNLAARPDLGTEAGLSLLVERGDSAMLFDTGGSHIAIDNARTMGLDLSRVSAVALSHNHYDHTRGLLDFAAQFPQPRVVYISRHFFKTCVWDRTAETGWMMPTSGPLSAARLSELGCEVRMVGGDVLEIEGFEGVWLMANLPNAVVPFETVEPTNYVLRGGEWVVDDYRDEMALVLECTDGLAVVTGCAHTGVCGIVQTAETRFGRPVRAVIGGTHLVAADDQRIAQTVEFLHQKQIPLLRPCHCTGEPGHAAFNAAGVPAGHAGDVFEF